LIFRDRSVTSLLRLNTTRGTFLEHDI